MNKKLPKVYVSPINKDLRNNKDIFYSSNKEIRNKDDNILKKVNEIFANPHHVYKSNVHIITSKGSFDTVIVGKNNNLLLTLEGNRININDIIDIERL